MTAGRLWMRGTGTLGPIALRAMDPPISSEGAPFQDGAQRAERIQLEVSRRLNPQIVGRLELYAHSPRRRILLGNWVTVRTSQRMTLKALLGRDLAEANW